MFSSLFVLGLQVITVIANTEKVIFLGPSNILFPAEHPTLEDLQLDVLSPQHSSLRTLIQAEFPTNASEYGQSSWILLQKLGEGQRYEVRLCWAATQPTSFRLNTYELPAVFENPELVTDLARYSEARQLYPTQVETQWQGVYEAHKKSYNVDDGVSSTMFLQIKTAADYYTMNKTLMENVSPVYVDIILDPYLFNVFPRSLIPTALYLVCLGLGSWYLSKYVSSWIQGITSQNTDPRKKKS